MAHLMAQYDPLFGCQPPQEAETRSGDVVELAVACLRHEGTDG